MFAPIVGEGLQALISLGCRKLTAIEPTICESMATVIHHGSEPVVDVVEAIIIGNAKEINSSQDLFYLIYIDIVTHPVKIGFSTLGALYARTMFEKNCQNLISTPGYKIAVDALIGTAGSLLGAITYDKLNYDNILKTAQDEFITFTGELYQNLFWMS